MSAPETTDAERAEGRRAVLDLFDRLRSYGEPPQICKDAANVGVALVSQHDADLRELDRFRAALRCVADVCHNAGDPCARLTEARDVALAALSA